MGVRLIVFLNFLCFGELIFLKVCYLFEEVVVGIVGYGNCVGILIVGGEI